jgi:hypothetical protein
MRRHNFSSHERDDDGPRRPSHEGLVETGSMTFICHSVEAGPPGPHQPAAVHGTGDHRIGRINSVLYIASVTQHRDIDEARVYTDRKIGEDKTRREARRANERHLANRIIRRMWNDRTTTPNQGPSTSRLTSV